MLVVVPAAATPAPAAFAATALGAVAPAVTEVLAEVGPDRVTDTVEVDADGPQGLAVVVVGRGRGLLARLGLVDGIVAPIGVALGDEVASGVEAQAVLGQRGVRRAAGVGEQAEQEVVGTDLAVAELAGDVRRLGDGDPGFGVETGVHGGSPRKGGRLPWSQAESRECFWWTA